MAEYLCKNVIRRELTYRMPLKFVTAEWTAVLPREYLSSNIMTLVFYPETGSRKSLRTSSGQLYRTA